jgi:hypothetical protein
MATTPDPLDALHAMRLPAPPASSLVETLALSVAAGAFAALLLAGALAVFAAWRQRRAPLRDALRTLDMARRLAPAERVCAHAAALRHYAVATVGADTGHLHGPAWLDRLDGLFATDFFSRGDGVVFGEALYRPLEDTDVEAVETILRRLFKHRRPR